MIKAILPSANVYEVIGRNIRHARENCGLSQEKLAKLLSLNRTSVTNIEKGRQRILVHMLFQVSAALSIPMLELLPRDSEIAHKPIEELLPDSLQGEAREWVLGDLRKL